MPNIQWNIALSIACLTLIALPARAAGEQAAKPPREDCTSANSEPLDVAQFAADPRKYGGHCVQVRGIIVARGFVRDQRELYETFSGASAGSPIIGVYGKEYATDGQSNLWGARVWADIFAYTYSCEEFSAHSWESARRANEEAEARGERATHFPFIAGLCHYRGGPVLWVSSWTVVPGLSTQLQSESDVERYRNLVEADERWSHFKDTRTVFVTWLDLVRSSDPTPLVEYYLKRYYSNLPNGRDSAKTRAEATRGAFSFLVGRAMPPIKVLLYTASYRRNETDFTAYGCICKETDCAGRWPTHTLDAAGDRASPFMCTEIAAIEGEPARVVWD